MIFLVRRPWSSPESITVVVGEAILAILICGPVCYAVQESTFLLGSGVLEFVGASRGDEAAMQDGGASGRGFQEQ